MDDFYKVGEEFMTVDEVNVLMELWQMGLTDYPIITNVYHVIHNQWK